MVMNTWPAKPARPALTLSRRATVLLTFPTPQAWPSMQTPYSNPDYQLEYSRNLIFEVGHHMDQVFQALIDRSRAPLDLKTIKTILGYKHRPKIHRRTKRSAEWEVA